MEIAIGTNLLDDIKSIRGCICLIILIIKRLSRSFIDAIIKI